MDEDDIAAIILRSMPDAKIEQAPYPFVGMTIVKDSPVAYYFRGKNAFVNFSGIDAYFCCKCYSKAQIYSVRAAIFDSQCLVEEGTGFLFHCKECNEEPERLIIISEKEEPSP